MLVEVGPRERPGGAALLTWPSRSVHRGRLTRAQQIPAEKRYYLLYLSWMPPWPSGARKSKPPEEPCGSSGGGVGCHCWTLPRALQPCASVTQRRHGGGRQGASLTLYRLRAQQHRTSLPYALRFQPVNQESVKWQKRTCRARITLRNPQHVARRRSFSFLRHSGMVPSHEEADAAKLYAKRGYRLSLRRRTLIAACNH